jgi:hypothetical protein
MGIAVIANPLDKVGVPTWLVSQAVQDGPEALERLRKHIGYLRAATARTYHPDVFPDDPRGTYRRVAEAAELLKTIDDIKAWAAFLLDPDSLDIEEAERLQALATPREEARRRALLNMLSVVDAFAMVDRGQPSELLFGLPDIDAVVATAYSYSFVLRLPGAQKGELMPVLHLAELILDFANVPVWDVQTHTWRVEGFNIAPNALPDSAPKWTVEHHERYGPAISAQLVGAVTAEDVARLYQISHVTQVEGTPQLPRGTLGLRELAPSQDASHRVRWYPTESAWWVDGMQPSLRVGDFGVILRPGTGELALVGRLLAVRSL